MTNGTTTVTSVTGGFTALMVGNGINIAGTSYMIATRSDTNTITVDRIIGAAVGQTGKVGGAWATPGYAAGQLTTACKCYIKAGTYTLSSASSNVSGGRITSPGGTAGFPFFWIGYQATRGDNGTKPVIDDGGVGGGGGVNVFGIGNAFTVVDNITVNGSNTNNVLFNIAAASVRVIRCKVSGTPLNGFFVASSYSSLLFCEGAVTSATAAFDIRAVCLLEGCVAHGSGADGFAVTGSNFVVMNNCISYGNGAAGYNFGAHLQVACHNCTAYGNTTDGFLVTSDGTGAPGVHLLNCLSYGNTSHPYNAVASSAFVDLINCAGDALPTNLPLRENYVTLTADPFASAPTNFGLNTTSGGGAACRAAGTPGVFAGLASTIGYPDIGAVQHQDVSPPPPSGGGERQLIIMSWARM